MSNIEIGTVSHGTLRPIDLLDTFERLLTRLDPEWVAGMSEDLRIARNAFDGTYAGDSSYSADDTVQADEAGQATLDALIDRLDELAPDGVRFGAHEGDGSDFGFWPVEDDDA